MANPRNAVGTTVSTSESDREVLARHGGAK